MPSEQEVQTIQPKEAAICDPQPELYGQPPKSATNSQPSDCQAVSSEEEDRLIYYCEHETGSRDQPGQLCYNKCATGVLNYVYRPEVWSHPATGKMGKFQPVFCDQCAQGRQRKAEWQVSLDATRRSYLLEQCKLPQKGVFEGLTLESFLQTANGNSEWFAQVKTWVDNWQPSVSSGLVLYGPCGVGKTGLLAAALKELVARYFASTFYITVADFCDGIGEAWSTKSGEDHRLVRLMGEVDVLCLDEVGASHGSIREMGDFSPLSRLFRVIDARYRQGKPMLAATNFETPGELMSALGERNYNRLYETCTELLCEGKNLRVKHRI